MNISIKLLGIVVFFGAFFTPAFADFVQDDYSVIGPYRTGIASALDQTLGTTTSQQLGTVRSVGLYLKWDGNGTQPSVKARVACYQTSSLSSSLTDCGNPAYGNIIVSSSTLPISSAGDIYFFDFNSDPVISPSVFVSLAISIESGTGGIAYGCSGSSLAWLPGQAVGGTTRCNPQTDIFFYISNGQSDFGGASKFISWSPATTTLISGSPVVLRASYHIGTVTDFRGTEPHFYFSLRNLDDLSSGEDEGVVFDTFVGNGINYDMGPVSTSTGNYDMTKVVGTLPDGMYQYYMFIGVPPNFSFIYQQAYFIMGETSYTDEQVENAYAQSDPDYLQNILDGQADTLACKILGGAFNLSDCFRVLLYPTAAQWQLVYDSLERAILFKFPFGYVTRIIDIVTDDSPSVLPTIDLNLPSSLPAGFAGMHIEFDPWQYMSSTTNFIGEMEDPNTGQGIQEIFEPLVQMLVYGVCLVIIWGDLTKVGENAVSSQISSENSAHYSHNRKLARSKFKRP